MLKGIIKYINTTIAHYNQENSNDFDRNVLVNIVSGMFNFNKRFRK